jgi:hypothetical protein
LVASVEPLLKISYSLAKTLIFLGSDPYREKWEKQVRVLTVQGQRTNTLIPFSICLIVTHSPCISNEMEMFGFSERLIGFYWKFLHRPNNLKVHAAKSKV